MLGNKRYAAARVLTAGDSGPGGALLRHRVRHKGLELVIEVGGENQAQRAVRCDVVPVRPVDCAVRSHAHPEGAEGAVVGKRVRDGHRRREDRHAATVIRAVPAAKDQRPWRHRQRSVGTFPDGCHDLSIAALVTIRKVRQRRERVSCRVNRVLERLAVDAEQKRTGVAVGAANQFARHDLERLTIAGVDQHRDVRFVRSEEPRICRAAAYAHIEICGAAPGPFPKSQGKRVERHP